MNSSKLTARDVMTRDVKAIHSDLTIHQAARVLADRGISGAPVLSPEGKLLGVVSITDIARAVAEEQSVDLAGQYYLQEPSAKPNALQGATERSSLKVGDIMTPMVFEVEAGASVFEVAETMRRGRIHRVFVVERDALVGVVSALDLLELVR